MKKRFDEIPAGELKTCLDIKVESETEKTVAERLTSEAFNTGLVGIHIHGGYVLGGSQEQKELAAHVVVETATNLYASPMIHTALREVVRMRFASVINEIGSLLHDMINRELVGPPEKGEEKNDDSK